jgi:hypothetical protein
MLSCDQNRNMFIQINDTLINMLIFLFKLKYKITHT